MRVKVKVVLGPSPGVAERGEVSGCSNSGLPPVPGTPSQHSGQSRQGTQNEQTPEGNGPQGSQGIQKQPQATANAASFTPGNPAMQGVQQGPGMQGPAMQGVQQGQQNVQGMPQGPAWFGGQWIPQQQQGFASSTTGCVSGAGTTGCVPGAWCGTTGCVSGAGCNTTRCVPGVGTTGCVPDAGFGTTGCVPGAYGTTGCVPGASGERFPGGLRPGFLNLGMNPENGPVPGAFLGGLTPQTAQVQEILAMLGGLNEGQLQSVQQQMQDRFVTLQQRRGFPEVFGDGLGRAADSASFVTPQPFDVLPGFGVQRSNNVGNQQLDIFSKSEKWLSPAPTPSATWKNREEEVLRWSGYLDELSSWAAGGSLEFSVEIQHSSRWPGPIKWSALSSVQQSRSRRLMSILKAAFHEHPRCVALIKAFSEGVSLHAVGQGDSMSVLVNQQSNGYGMSYSGS